MTDTTKTKQLTGQQQVTCYWWSTQLAAARHQHSNV